MDRRTFLGSALACVVSVPSWASPHRQMLVTKDPNCGCCGVWADIARRHGFEVVIEESTDMTAFKDGLGVPAEVRSCHTAQVDGYVLEGHVPMEAVDRLLKERPRITGLAVPGMPMGSPGMGDDPKAAYDVLAFDRSKNGTSVFYTAGQIAI